MPAALVPEAVPLGVLERETELAVVAEAIAGAREGHGSVLLIEGPAGLGKTLLLTCASEAAAANGLRTLRASGAELERHSPFGVMRELFEPVVQGLGADERASLAVGAAAPAQALLCSGDPLEVPVQEAPFTLVHAFYWVAANLAERTTLFLSTDDLHWADPASLRALAYLASRVEELPMVLALSLRSGEPDAPAELQALRADGRVRALYPRPLSLDAAAQLVGEELGSASEAFCGACHDATGGSPFLLRELIREVRERDLPPDDRSVERIGQLVPESVGRTTVARVDRLGRASAALARAVAVLETAEPWTAAELAELNETDAAEATARLSAAGILARGLPLRFAHPLQRAAVYSELTHAARDAAHRRAARLLTEPASVASQLLRTEPRGEQWATQALRTAGQQALAAGSPESAVRALSRALDEEQAAEAPAELLLELAQAELACGETRALERLETALERATRPLTRAVALAALGQGRYLHGDIDVALTTTRSALDELAGQDTDLLETNLLGSYVLAARASPGHVGDVAALLERPREGSADIARLAFRAFHGLLRGEPRAELDRLARQVLSDPRQREALMPMAMAAFVLAALDDFATAEGVLADQLDQARRRGSAVDYLLASDARGWSRSRQGMITLALADCETLLELADRGWEPHAVTALAHRSELLLELGDVAGAEQALEISEELEARLPGVWSYLWLPYARSGLALAQGDVPRALDEATACGRRLEEVDAPNPGFCPWRSRAALAASRLGDLDRARELYGEELRLARRFGTRRAIGIALRSGGLVEGGEHGLSLLEDAVQALDGSAAVLERARTLVEYGGALRRVRQQRAAREPLRKGLELALGCGATVLAHRARDELRASGARPRRERTRGPASLTPRELRVAELAVTGLSNPEIAQALFVSRRTVESHLHSAFGKLDITDRTQLARALEPSVEDHRS